MYQSKKPYLYGTGRRKSSVARVHLFPNGMLDTFRFGTAMVSTSLYKA